MRLCTIIVLYHPEVDILKISLPVYSKESEEVFLWANSSISIECKNVINSFPNTKILGNGINVGISAALNQSIKLAEKSDFTHVLTMDQDSYFDEGVITKYKDKIVTNEFEHVGIFGINPLQNGHTLYKISSDILNVSDTITSGSIFKIKNFQKTGYFKEDFFIDAVDYEYCYRAKDKYNLKTIVFSDILLNHTVGYIEKTKFGFSINNYSPFRTYFIIRNQFKIWKMYPSLFPMNYKVTLIKDHLLFRIIKIIIAEDKKIMKLKAIIIGFYHFLTNKSGFYNIDSKS